MKTNRGFRMEPATGRRQPLDRAAEALSNGGVVIFPTETVYGLGADFGCARAVARLRRLKGLEPDRPLLVHCADTAQALLLAARIPAAAQRLIDAFWPGPLALILPKSPSVPDDVSPSAGIGIRVVDHDVARGLILCLGRPVAGTSANVHGSPPPLSLSEVAREIADGVDCVMDGGRCRFGAASTVVDATADRPRLLRRGAIAAAEIETVLGLALEQPGRRTQL